MPGSLMTPSAFTRPKDKNKKPNRGFIAPRFDGANAKQVAEDAFTQVSNGDNEIHVDSVATLMKALGFFGDRRNRGRDLVVALGQMGAGQSTSVTRVQFCTWYVANVSDFGGSALNRLLVKDQLGKGRTPSYQLPGDNFTYGHVNKWDSEGAGQVALTWVKGKLSGTQRGRRNIVAENKAAAGAGAPTGKALANYRKANPKYIRAKVVGMANRSTIPVGQGEKNLCYGIASVPSEKVGEIMKPTRLQMQAFDQNYPDMSGQQMPGKMPMPRPTHGSNLLYQNARLPKSNDQEGNFKMKKFLRVEGRVNSNNNRRK